MLRSTALLMAGCLLVVPSCGSDTVPTAADQTPVAEVLPLDPVQLAPTGPVLPPPADLLKGVSYVDADRVRAGADYMPLLPHNRVAAYGTDAVLFPSWESGLSAARDGLSYCIYGFTLDGYDLDPSLWLSWQVADVSPPDLWIGISSWEDGTWRWQTGPAGTELPLGTLDPYVEPATGACVVAVMLLGTDTWRLEWLRFGPNAPPRAELSAAPLAGPAPLTVDFDASASSDLDGSIVKYEWDWDGDGTWDADSGAIPFDQHVYSTTGSYQAKVRVTDDLGATGTGSITALTIKVNDAPVASLAADPALGEGPLEVRFDTTGTQDSDGTIEGFDWDWDGDGTYEVLGGGASPWYTYGAAGTYHPTVRVHDNDGATDTASVEVRVLEWVIDVVDTQIGHGAFSSIALDSSDQPRISYYDDFLGDLLFATCTAGSWDTEVVDESGNVGLNTSLVLDSADNPHIGYFDKDNGWVKYAYHNGTSWDITEVRAIWKAGEGGISIALDSSEVAHFAYHRFDGSFNWMQYAYPDGGGGYDYWDHGTGDTGITVSLEIDQLDLPCISTYDANGQFLYYIYSYGPPANPQIVDGAGNVGMFSSVELDSLDRPHISYQNGTRYDLCYAWHDGSDWVVETASSSSSKEGYFTCLALDSTDAAHIVHQDWDSWQLLYTTNRGGSWTTVVLDSDGSAGWWPSVAIDSHDLPHVSYHEADDDELRYAHLDS